MHFNHLRILMVDENGPTRRHVSAMLHQIGVGILDEAGSAAEAFGLLRDHFPDVLLVGHVPDCEDGIAFTRLLRSTVRRDLPIILVSGYADLWRLGEAKEAGANEFLVAPFTIRSLIQRLHRASTPAREASARDCEPVRYVG
ncbi:response regulator [Telmatospirillum sp.]|uniref:response regulator n=1 Tax=Telmatospirillum sp. TaxID=2079197 RepID=UPI0028412D41|nr:response regulator [Telmatospirillum sp.]MDR3435716.1 response regulator [Telmatospirillum sp.]